MQNRWHQSQNSSELEPATFIKAYMVLAFYQLSYVSILLHSDNFNYLLQSDESCPNIAKKAWLPVSNLSFHSEMLLTKYIKCMPENSQMRLDCNVSENVIYTWVS